MDSSADEEGHQSTRHGVDPAPGAAPVPGAFGREGADREPEGRPAVPSRLDEDLDDIDVDLDEDDGVLELEHDPGGDEPGERG